MGTLKIIQALLFHIQGESNPIYNVERIYANQLSILRWRSYYFLVLVLLVPVLGLIEAQFGIRLSAYRDQLTMLGLTVVGGVLSLVWIVPLVVLSGQGVIRERAMQTWPMLMVMPYPTEVVLMAKAAAGIRNVWGRTLGAAFLASILGLFIAGPLILTTSITSGQGVILGVLLMGIGMIIIVVEHEQEVALAIALGLAVAFTSDSRRMSLLLGMAGGVLIRLIQTVLTFIIILLIGNVIPLNVAILNSVAGSVTMLAAVPSLISVLIVIGLSAVREVIIRALFAWTVQRAQEG
jgi:hypothetical protein